MVLAAIRPRGKSLRLRCSTCGSVSQVRVLTLGDGDGRGHSACRGQTQDLFLQRRGWALTNMAICNQGVPDPISIHRKC